MDNIKIVYLEEPELKSPIMVEGLPGVGKSLYIRELALAAHAAGRAVHLLQWDVARPAFELPGIIARYPERDGVTHAVIRKAVGQWAREAVVQWGDVDHWRKYREDIAKGIDHTLAP